MIRAWLDPLLKPALGIAAAGVACTILVAAVDIVRGAKTKEQESIFFIVQTCLAGLTILAAHRFYFDAQIPIVFPYVGLKVLALCLALATPARSSLAWLCFVLLALGPLVQSLTWIVIDHGHYDFLESAINIEFVGFAVLLWLSRVRLQRVFHHLLWFESRAKTAENLANILLSARHLQNSALQAIEARTALIEFELPEAQRHTQEIQKSINQVVRLASALEVYDAQADWKDFVPPRDHTEFESRILDFQEGRNALAPDL